MDFATGPARTTSLPRRNETIDGLALNNPANAASMILTWDMPVAGNDWWWAIDNIEVKADMVSNPFGINDDTSWNFNTFTTPKIGFSSVEASVAEDGGEVMLTVVRQGDTSTTLSVDYAVTIGTASAADFGAGSGTVDFAENEAEQTILVSITEDSVTELNETFTVTLSNPTGGAELDDASTATVTIIDNDRPVIVFQQGVETVIDGTGTGVTYEGTQDADPRAAGPDEFRDSASINVDGEDGGQDPEGNDLRSSWPVTF